MSEIKNVSDLELLNGRVKFTTGGQEGFAGTIGYYPNGTLHFKYPVVEGEFHGACRCWHENGVLASEENYIRGRLTAHKKSWYPSGNPKAKAFYGPHGLEGAVKAWHDNGQLKSESYYEKGVKQGPATCWHGNGMLRSKMFFKNGLSSGVSMDWDDKGQKLFMVTFRSGVRHGLYQEWRENDALKMSCSYRQGVLDGIKTEWYPDGKIHIRIPYSVGLVHGVKRVWSENGKLISEGMFIRGALAAPKLQNILRDIKKGRFDARDILKMNNASLRRICLEEFGYGRFLTQLNGEVLDKDDEDELIRINWHSAEEPIYLVKVKCPSTEAFYTLRVPPRVKTVKQGIAWTFRMRKKGYAPEEEA